MTPSNVNSLVHIPGYRHIQDPQRICRLQGSGNYTLIYLREAKTPLLVSKSLIFFAEQLPDFIRVSKSSMINPMDIVKVMRWDARRMEIELSDGTSLRVARRRAAELLDELKKHADRRKVAPASSSRATQIEGGQPIHSPKPLR